MILEASYKTVIISHNFVKMNQRRNYILIISPSSISYFDLQFNCQTNCHAKFMRILDNIFVQMLDA